MLPASTFTTCFATPPRPFVSFFVSSPLYCSVNYDTIFFPPSISMRIFARSRNFDIYIYVGKVYTITGEDARKRLNRRKEGLSVEYSGYWV